MDEIGCVEQINFLANTTNFMSNKEIVIDMVQRLPEETSLLEIAREIEFVAGVREGFAQLDRGEGVPLEEVEKQLPSWILK